jgi:type I restriction enzyme S subunit
MAKLSSSNGIEKFPKLRFPEFKEPWNLVKLEDVCSYRKGRAKVKKAQYISTENILQNYAGIEPYDDLSEAEGISIQCGDTLMANIRPYLKKVWQSNFNGACSTDVLAFSPDNIDGKFLYFLIAQDRFVNYVMCGAKGSKMPRGDKNHILEYETGVPTESEQRKIAHFIDLLNARISSQNSLINLIKKYKRGSLSALFPKKREITPQYRFAGFTKPWEQRKAKELFVSTADKGYPELPVLSATQDRGMIRRDENSINIFHDKKNEAGYKRVLPGQFVIHLRSFQGGFAYSAIEGITSPAYTVFGFSEPEKHDSEYWKYVFTSKSFIRRLETVTYGIRDGRSISYEEFLTLGFVYPSKAEQTAIARCLDKLSDLITLHQHKYDTLLSLKNAILQQMFI